MKNNRYLFYLIILFTGVILYSYADIWGIYFLHDEWRHMAGLAGEGLTAGFDRYPLWQVLLGAGRVVGTFAGTLITVLFPYQTYPFIIVYLIIHTINSLLVYYVLETYTGNSLASLIGALFFAATSRNEQALTWIGAGVQVLLSTFFVLLILLLFRTFQKYKQKTGFILLGLLSYISYLIRPSAIFIVPVIAYLYGGEYVRKVKYFQRKLFLIAIALLGTIFAILVATYSIDTFIRIGSANQDITQIKLLFNAIFYPYISLGQYLLPFRFTNRIAWWLLSFLYPVAQTTTNVPYLVYFILSDMVSGVVSFCFILVLFILFIKRKPLRKLISLGVIWLVFSLLPYAFSLPDRNDSYLDSRYVYATTVAASMFITALFVPILEFIKKLRRFNNFAYGSLLVLLVLFFYKQAAITRREVRLASIEGTEMRNFVVQYRKTVTVLPSNPIIYADSDRTYFYTGNKLPFLLGAGYILSVLNIHSNLPYGPIRNETFVGFGSEGYVESEGRGYGYFWQKRSITDEFLRNPTLKPGQVVGLYWDSKHQKLIDITDDIRKLVSTASAYEN